MIKIGLISADSFAVAKSIPFFIDLAKKEFGIDAIVINPDENKKDISVDVLYPRILPVADQKLLLQRVKYYAKLVKKSKLPHTVNPTILKKEFDKFEQIKMVERLGFAVPKSYLAKNYKQALKYCKKLEFPVVVKDVIGYGGEGVYLANDQDELKNIIRSRKKYLIQEFIKLLKIEDYRVYIVDGKAIGGIRRENSKKGEFRSNTTQGASASFFVPDASLGGLAEKIAKGLGNEIASIDFVKKNDDYIFIEINNSFDIQTANEPKKIIIARAIINYCIKKANQNI